MNEKTRKVYDDLQHDARLLTMLPESVDVAEVERYANRLHGAILRASAR